MIENNGIVLIPHPAKTLTTDEKVCFQSCCSCHETPMIGRKWEQVNKLKITAHI